eukprot:2062865-Rhodomonas_salina.1
MEGGGRRWRDTRQEGEGQGKAGGREGDEREGGSEEERMGRGEEGGKEGRREGGGGRGSQYGESDIASWALLGPSARTNLRQMAAVDTLPGAQHAAARLLHV